jgi:NDP-sugar pyrophosphorylase family protein
MNYAIIAAGEGSRLAQEGITEPKPLVRLNGVPLLDRLINIFLNNNAEAINIIVNRENIQVQKHIQNLELPVPLNLVIKSTPSSLHSFYELSSFLQNKPFVLTTVDTVFDEQEFKSYIEAFESNDNVDGLMGVTTFIDDEKPLYVNIEENKIIAFTDTPEGNDLTVSGGIYGLHPTIFPSLNKAMDKGVNRMRNFQRMLVEDGLALQPFLFKKVMDIDHASDIKKAEEFLQKINDKN